jgi:SAM-dependent methyltransferase
MLFFEVFSGLPRQGPGDAASTLRALALVPGIRAGARVLDIGCGSGLQTRVLAQHSAAHFVAIDNHVPFIEELKRHAHACGLADRIDACVGDMRNLELPPGSFDVIWCEGAIYAIGFETGLREWRRFLVPGGYLALTEVCWTKRDAPEECLAFWSREYSAIRETSLLLEAIAQAGYETVGHFPLPRSAWWDDYYRPLEQNLGDFRERHAGELDAQELADQIQREIDIWQAYSDFYGYEFFVMRACLR